MPFQFSGVGVERDEAIGVQVIAGADRAVKIRRRIARAPVENVEFRVVRPGHPSGATSALIHASRPALRTRFSRRRDGPKLPGQFSGLRIES